MLRDEHECDSARHSAPVGPSVIDAAHDRDVARPQQHRRLLAFNVQFNLTGENDTVINALRGMPTNGLGPCARTPGPEAYK